MLVLSRRENEKIRVGDSITVTVVRVGKDRVRIGIEAPGDVLVLRDELEQDTSYTSVSHHATSSACHSLPTVRAPLASRLPSRRPMRQEMLSVNDLNFSEEETETENEADLCVARVEENDMAVESNQRSSIRQFFRW